MKIATFAKPENVRWYFYFMAKPFSIKDRFKSFQFAFNEIRQAVKYEHNFRIHLSAAAFVIGLSFIAGLSRLDWATILIVICIVLFLELVNS